jgi:hypothetical protein
MEVGSKPLLHCQQAFIENTYQAMGVFVGN